MAWKAHQLELARLEDTDDGEAQPRSISSIRRENTSDVNKDDSRSSSGEIAKDCHPTSIEKLCPSHGSMSKIHLICSWTANGSSISDVVRGEHHIMALSVRPESSIRGCPITATADYEDRLSHDFRKGPVRIPYKMTFRNQMVETDIDFEVVMDQSDAFEVIGGDFIPSNLKGGQEMAFPLEALVQAPGIHDLQTLKLYISHEGASQIYKLPLQWLVRVDEAFSTTSS